VCWVCRESGNMEGYRGRPDQLSIAWRHALSRQERSWHGAVGLRVLECRVLCDKAPASACVGLRWGTKCANAADVRGGVEVITTITCH
jgi:hypothetical protein